MCFIDKKLVWQYKVILVKKSTPIIVKVIDGWSISSRYVMHETKALDITIEMHTNKVAFNVISSPKRVIVIVLSWLILHNPWMDWCIKKFHFHVPHKVVSKCEKITSKNIINEGKDYHLDESCIKLSKGNKYLGGAQNVKSSKALFVGARTFMQVAQKGNEFLIYALPISKAKLLCHDIPS